MCENEYLWISRCLGVSGWDGSASGSKCTCLFVMGKDVSVDSDMVTRSRNTREISRNIFTNMSGSSLTGSGLFAHGASRVWIQILTVDPSATNAA